MLEKGGLEVTFASLFERPTPLEGEAGMRHWVEMFANHLLNQIAPEKREDPGRRPKGALVPAPAPRTTPSRIPLGDPRRNVVPRGQNCIIHTENHILGMLSTAGGTHGVGL